MGFFLNPEGKDIIIHMDMRQAFMLFLCAHAFAFYYFSSFGQGKKPWRLIIEFLIYTIAIALVFSPVLDGNNYLYALSILILHLLLSVIYFFTAGRSGNEKVRDTVFVIFEILKIAAFAALAFLHSVRWGSFEPWRQVRFFLDRFALDYNQVLSFAFTLVLIIRPANVIIRKLLSLIEEGQNENTRYSGSVIGIIERLLYAYSVFYGSWLAFAVFFFAKCALFSLVIRKREDYGMRLYTGSVLSALCVIPPCLIAEAFF